MLISASHHYGKIRKLKNVRLGTGLRESSLSFNKGISVGYYVAAFYTCFGINRPMGSKMVKSALSLNETFVKQWFSLCRSNVLVSAFTTRRKCWSLAFDPHSMIQYLQPVLLSTNCYASK